MLINTEKVQRCDDCDKDAIIEIETKYQYQSLVLCGDCLLILVKKLHDIVK